MSYIKLSKLQELVWKVDSVNSKRADNDKYLITSGVDSAREIRLIANKIDFGYHKNFVIFGMRNLDLINEIYRRKTPFSTMVIIEITEVGTNSISLDGNQKQLDILKDPRVTLIIGSENELGKQLDLAFNDILKMFNLRNTEILSMPYVKSKYPEEFNNVLDMMFQKLRTSLVSYGNDVEDILIGMDNYINNWNHVFKGIDCKDFENKYKGTPAIIVGAGPSLDKNIDFLEKAKGKALIFSVDGAMNTLLDKCIMPDVVSSIERVQLTANFYQKQEIPQDIIYVGPNVVRTSILDKFSRIIFTGRQGDGLFRGLNNELGLSNLEIGTNVSNVLISFARHLGCYPVIFIGLDLAYTNGKTHTKKFSENFDEDFMKNYKRNTMYVKGQNGEMLETFEHFMHTKTWIESMIAQDKEGLFINATEGGANIEGSLNSKLNDVINTYCKDKEITSLKALYDEIKSRENEDRKLVLTKKAKDFFKQSKDYFIYIESKADEFYNKLESSMEQGRVALMEKMRREMEDILNIHAPSRFIIQSIIISYGRDIHSFPMRMEKQDEIDMFERSLKYYKTLQEVSRKVNESVNLYIEVLESHI